MNMPILATPSPKVLLALTGGIACYKSAILARLLIKAGCQVRVMMTPAACQFITPLSLQALTGNEVHTELLDAHSERGMGHIELAKWADLVVLAPASANTIGKLANGLADNLVATALLATTAPVWLYPAMNQAMWHKTQVQENVDRLTRLGYKVVMPAGGEQACGDVGVGRLPEPESICDEIVGFFNRQNTVQSLAGKTVVITAGATLEPIDPVRYLSNHSTGKMGYALASACVNAGAKVSIVAGQKVNLPTPIGATKITIITADEMLAACQQACQQADIFIATAAVADFKVKHAATQKLKKTTDNDLLTLELIKNPDILATISQTYPHLLTVGFAAETNAVEDYAKGKLVAKNLDMIACNDVSDQSIGFGSDHNAMTVFFADKYAKSKVVLNKASKHDIARQLVTQIGAILAY
ncbi:bifunctional phosphopantothenoylcysteine decarboxylase/phosphopantothenate--cysteine ligase CoaBC [Moraxella oculi]|uniref:Coenzyme A biosynthesis bifunctional protein CoaBC n=1 Tax=Moraxella oculi TaxID=2940516 RepID=A0ABW8U9A4_9GAMM